MDLMRWDRQEWHLPHLRISRQSYPVGGGNHVHGHDFAEWLWVESGRLAHRRIGGREEILNRGDARFLRPGEAHVLTGIDGAVLVTASVPAKAWRLLQRRHGASPAWPWASGAARFTDGQLSWLTAASAELPVTRQDPSDADWYVAGMLRLLRDGQTAPAAPDWLASAVTRLSEPGRLALGLPALIGMSGRSPEHVSRAVRRHYACTARELVLRLRLDHAARGLRLTSRPIPDLAEACGFASLAHFYRSFRARFGVTPADFRVGTTERIVRRPRPSAT